MMAHSLISSNLYSGPVLVLQAMQYMSCPHRVCYDVITVAIVIRTILSLSVAS